MGKKEDLEIVDLELGDLSPRNSDENGQERDVYWDEQPVEEAGRGIGRRPVREAPRGHVGRTGRETAHSSGRRTGRDNPRDNDDGKGNGKKPGKIVAIVLVCAGIVCLLAGGGLLVRNRIDAGRNQEQLETLRNQAQGNGTPEEAPQSGTDAVQQEPGTAEGNQPGTGDGTEPGTDDAGPGTNGTDAVENEPVRIPNPYADSYLQNEDMVAWLKIEDTKVDYPVMQTMEDENYYLKRGFDKKSNQNGCLILDTDSVLGQTPGTNLIIHGHNMKSGEMFGTLTKYEDQSYCEAHKYIQLYTRDCLRNYEVIAVFRSQVFRKTDEVFKFYKFFQADTQEEFDDWYQNIMALSEYDTGVTAEFGDRFITLSTCVYHVENGRLVVVAKEIEPGDYYEPVE